MKRFLAVFAALILCGCGQSGPLYIPGNPSRVENPPAQPDEASEEEAADENGNSDGDTG